MWFKFKSNKKILKLFFDYESFLHAYMIYDISTKISFRPAQLCTANVEFKVLPRSKREEMKALVISDVKLFVSFGYFKVLTRH